jgi:predicted amidohydrolase
MAAARSSRLATVISDRWGTERGVDWTGGSAVIDEDGWVAALPEGGGPAVATLTLRTAGDKALPPHNDLFLDRRPDLY